MANSSVRLTVLGAATLITAVAGTVYLATRGGSNAPSDTSEVTNAAGDADSARTQAGPDRDAFPTREDRDVTQTDENAAPTPEQLAAQEEFRKRREAMKELRELVGEFPVSMSSNREERIAAARAWLKENTELSPREIELQAQMLALYEDLITGEVLSPSQIFQAQDIEMLALWSGDANGDGVLSPEEAQTFISEMQSINFDMMSHEFLAEHIDLDGDGEISSEEQMAVGEKIMEKIMPSVNVIAEFGALRAWDTDRDGVLTAEERAAGEAALEFTDWDGDGEINDQERMTAMQINVQDVWASASLVGSYHYEVEQDWQALAENAPKQDAYDADGDGELSSEEMQAFGADTQAYYDQYSQESEGSQVEWYQRKFTQLSTDLDLDGDQALNDNEWRLGYEKLRDERDMRLFTMFHDADQNGTIDGNDINIFLTRYNSQSQYADVNLDGVIDQNDATLFLEMADRAGN